MSHNGDPMQSPIFHYIANSIVLTTLFGLKVAAETACYKSEQFKNIFTQFVMHNFEKACLRTSNFSIELQAITKIDKTVSI